jgi:DNA-binding CsgD family transcriptional regulator
VTRLGEKDLRRLTDSLGELYQACTLDAFPRRALSVLPSLVGCDTSSYNVVNPALRRVAAHTEPANFALPGMVRAYEEHVGQHPLIRHYQATRDGRALKIADFLSLQEFRRLPLYREFYSVVGVDRQLAVTVPGRPGVVIGLAVSRAGRDFSERDRAALDFLRPHLARAHASAATLTALGMDIRAMSDAAGGRCDGTVIVAANGRVSYLSDEARDLLSRYLESAKPGGFLPWPLRPWCAAALARMHPVCRAPAVLGSRQVRRGPSSLTLTLIAADVHGSTLLALAEHRGATSAGTASLGLTPRETEVLSLAAEGKTNRDIADSLRISPLTVRKHLEHAYPKLGVGNRTAAAARFRR